MLVIQMSIGGSDESPVIYISNFNIEIDTCVFVNNKNKRRSLHLEECLNKGYLLRPP
jgi:hypothetical protein